MKTLYEIKKVANASEDEIIETIISIATEIQHFVSKVSSDFDADRSDVMEDYVNSDSITDWVYEFYTLKTPMECPDFVNEKTFKILAERWNTTIEEIKDMAKDFC